MLEAETLDCLLLLYSLTRANIQTRDVASISTRGRRQQEASRAKLCPLTETRNTMENAGSWVHLSSTPWRTRNTKRERGVSVMCGGAWAA